MLTESQSRGSWRLSCSPVTLARYVVLVTAVLLSCYTLSKQFGRKAQITHCPARLEAAGVHYSPAGGGLQQENGARQQAYDIMHASLHDKGLELGNKVTQGLSMRDLFQVKGGIVVPQLTALDTPVRAIVAPVVDNVAAKRLQDSFEKHVLPLASATGVWPQNSNLYHTTVWHASPHQHPVPADRQQVEEEVSSIKRAVHELCPMHFALERIVINSAGVVMACWQISRGTSTSNLRSAVQAALPSAPPPDKQTVQNTALWYTTLGRLLEPPKKLRAGPGLPAALDAVAQEMTEDLCGMQTRIDRVWYVQEYDKLALALAGRWDMQEALLSDNECF